MERAKLGGRMTGILSERRVRERGRISPIYLQLKKKITAELSFLKFRRAQHEAGEETEVDLLHRVIEGCANDLRVQCFPVEGRSCCVRDLPREKHSFDAIQRQFRISTHIQTHKRIYVDLCPANFVVRQSDSEVDAVQQRSCADPRGG